MMLVVHVMESVLHRVLQYEKIETYGKFRGKDRRGAKAEAGRLYMVYGKINITVDCMTGAVADNWRRRSAASFALALVERFYKSTI